MDRQIVRVPAFLLMIPFMMSMADATIVSKTVEYKVGNQTMKGYLAYDDSISGEQPGVVVFPEWWGVTDYSKIRARELAALGYVAFVADMYGDGKTTAKPDEAQKWAGDARPHMRERAEAGLEQLEKAPHVDKSRLGAIGFCFGGTCALELAYSGAPLAGVVSFHGGLTTPKEGDKIKASILVCTGAADPTISQDQLNDFKKALEERGADWEMDIYAKAKHAFTNPSADKFGMDAIGYNETATHRAMARMAVFFKEVFGVEPTANPANYSGG